MSCRYKKISVIQNYSHTSLYNLPPHIHDGLIKYAKKHGRRVSSITLKRLHLRKYLHMAYSLNLDRETETLLLFHNGKIYVDTMKGFNSTTTFYIIDKLPGPLEMMIVMSLKEVKS